MGSLIELETYAKENSVPIIQKDGLKFLLNFIKENKILSILELGTAIGYSAINMALISENIKITTIERDKNMYSLACQNVKNFSLENQITLIFADALEANITGKFDLIFIDAAKAQYIKFFEKYKKNLNKKGIIITDNLNFHGLAKNPEEIKSKNLKALVKKINLYKEFLKENKDYSTTFYEIGDGIAISKRKGE